jgi:Flp pilus assembly protein TadG
MIGGTTHRNFPRELVSMLFSRFWKCQKGGAGPLLALSMIPIMGAVAASVDYSRASLARNAMQSALDATALMLSKTAQGMSSADLNAKATTYFNAVFNHTEAATVTVTSALTQPAQGNFTLTLNGTGTVNTLFMPGPINLSATSQVLWGIKKLNLALVLDNTGSMAQSGKMTALKSAAHNLLSTLQAAAKTPGDVQVSIVPFAVDVNVGANNVNATWIGWSNYSNYGGGGSGWNSGNGNNSHSNWNGCVMDRDQNYDVQNTAPLVGSASTLFPAEQASACPVAMMPLSYDWTALNNKIDAMTPTGNTNITIGLALGWQTLTASAPFNAPAAATDLDKVIILLTDGENTENRWTTSASSINARTTTACNNIKAANIKIYTVRVIDGNSSLLQSCATNPTMYYDVSQASQLNGVFTSIAQNLANLRIAQ